MIAQELQNGHYLGLVQGPLLNCVGITANETDERSEGPLLALNDNSGAPHWPLSCSRPRAAA
jgi:hypothetical protein